MNSFPVCSISDIRHLRPAIKPREVIMRKAAIRDGDPTTTRGLVRAYSSTIYDDGKKVALSGDEATCGTCEGTFKILGTGQGMSEKGRNAVVEGDVVLCPCGANRVLVGRNPGIFLETSGNVDTAANAAAPNNARRPTSNDEDLECYYEFVRETTGQPIEGMTYKLLSDGRTLVDNASLVDGRTRAFSLKDHPNLKLVAWHRGCVR
jgi:uncharacterized Zn-binding protein involved in type VI secretion